MIIKSDNSKRIIAVMTQNTSLNQNLKEMLELHISDKEHEKIVKKTISNVINKLEQQIEI